MMNLMSTRGLLVAFALFAAQISFAQSKNSVEGLVKLNDQEVKFVYENGAATLGDMDCQLMGGLTQVGLGVCGKNMAGYALTILFIEELTMDRVVVADLAEAYKGKTVRQFLNDQFEKGDVAQIAQLTIKKENCAADANALVALIDSSKANPNTTQADMIAATQVGCAKLVVK